ncbi:MAG: exodeoxyribonuclease VII large subunit [Campylobacteraceae bacterium]
MLSNPSVSDLNRQIAALLESTFLHVKVEGEVSRPTYHSSGHLYFTLKDETSAISCVMFKGNAAKLKFQIEDGMKLVIDGSISVYVPRGSYQINCIHAEPSGAGALAVAYEQLKEKLKNKGYFENKKPLPKFPTHITIVTSKTGAALQDMLNVANKRFPLTKLTLVPATVQGDSAKFEISEAIKKADALNSDIMIIGRGGGSIEDLWAFNEEMVADAVFNAKTPIISAVGHEIDFVISDFVADLRAPTPSAAMELALPDQNELKQTIDFRMMQLINTMQKIISKKEEYLAHLKEIYNKNSYDAKIELGGVKLANLQTMFNAKLQSLLELKTGLIKDNLSSLHVKFSYILNQKESLYKSLSGIYYLKESSKESKDGFAQIVKDGKKVALESLHVNDEFELQNPQIKLRVKALEKETIK